MTLRDSIGVLCDLFEQVRYKHGSDGAEQVLSNALKYRSHPCWLCGEVLPGCTSHIHHTDFVMLEYQVPMTIRLDDGIRFAYPHTELPPPKEWKCEVCGLTVPAFYVHEHIDVPVSPFYWIETAP